MIVRHHRRTTTIATLLAFAMLVMQLIGAEHRATHVPHSHASHVAHDHHAYDASSNEHSVLLGGAWDDHQSRIDCERFDQLLAANPPSACAPQIALDIDRGDVPAFDFTSFLVARTRCAPARDPPTSA
jgi:hypothetical protein